MNIEKKMATMDYSRQKKSEKSTAPLKKRVKRYNSFFKKECLECVNKRVLIPPQFLSRLRV